MDADRLAVFAAHAQASRGRLHAEPGSAHRSPFQRDRDRIIHSSAFRRLKHKTQVFAADEGETTVETFGNPSPGAPRLYFRVLENPMN